MNELDLFTAAVGLTDVQERAALLDRECAARPELRRRLDQLLAAHFKAQPIVDRTDGYELAMANAGRIVAGRYKLLEMIGDGGMGTVWMAEQREPVKRVVAVKLIKAGMDSKAVIATVSIS